MRPVAVRVCVGAGLAVGAWLYLRRRSLEVKKKARRSYATVVTCRAGGRAQPHAVMPTGKLMPLLGLGTWQSKGGEVKRAVISAIEGGYRHIDCAKCYDNEKEVGAAIRDCLDRGVCRREELWVTSKLWNTEKRGGDVRPALKRTLRDLQLEYVDLYLVHWPTCWGRVANCECHSDSAGSGVICPFPKRDDGGLLYGDVPHEETWRALEACVAQGLATHIGVSNFNAAQLEALVGVARIRPAVNQIELHPYNASEALCDACADAGVVLTSYSTLGHGSGPSGGRLLEDPTVVDAAERHGLTPAQVLIKFQIERGISAIPKSVTPARIASNLDGRPAQTRRRGRRLRAPGARRRLALLREPPGQAPRAVSLQGRAADASAARSRHRQAVAAPAGHPGSTLSRRASRPRTSQL